MHVETVNIEIENSHGKHVDLLNESDTSVLIVLNLL